MRAPPVGSPEEPGRTNVIRLVMEPSREITIDQFSGPPHVVSKIVSQFRTKFGAQRRPFLIRRIPALKAGENAHSTAYAHHPLHHPSHTNDSLDPGEAKTLAGIDALVMR